MTETNPSKFKKYWIPFTTAALAALVSGVIFILPAPQSTQFYETTAARTRTVNIAPGISVHLDKRSAITVTNSQPISAELIIGNAYFFVEEGTLAATAGNARITASATGFSMELLDTGALIAIAEGEIEMQLGSLTRSLHAGQKIEVDNTSIVEETSIVIAEIAPWREEKYTD
jgi:ferric-dicitrate binding protein FerR (iron transport regulator)